MAGFQTVKLALLSLVALFSPSALGEPDAESPDLTPVEPEHGAEQATQAGTEFMGPEIQEDSWVGELPVDVSRTDKELILTLTEPWAEAELGVGGCAVFSDSYGPSKIGKVLTLRTTSAKPCEVELSFARPDLSGVMVVFQVEKE